METGSFQSESVTESPFSRDSRDLRDSRDSREPPAILSRDSREFRVPPPESLESGLSEDILVGTPTATGQRGARGRGERTCSSNSGAHR